MSSGIGIMDEVVVGGNSVSSHQTNSKMDSAFFKAGLRTDGCAATSCASSHALSVKYLLAELLA